MLRSFLSSRTVHASALMGLLVAACGGTESNPCTTDCGGPTGTNSTDTTVTSGPATNTVQPGPATSTPTGATSSNTTAPLPTGSSGPSVPTGPSGTTAPPTTGPSGTTDAPVDTSGPADTTDADSSSPDETVDPGPGPSGDPNPSGLPEPGNGGVPRPDGAAGNLEVIPWAGFAGALSYTFDDATSSQWENKTQILELGVPFTWYLNVNNTGNMRDMPLNAMYAEVRDLGHELGNHTYDHTQDNSADATRMQTWLKDQYGIVAYTFAAPNGNVGPFSGLVGNPFLLVRAAGGGSEGTGGPANWGSMPSAIPPQNADEQVFRGYADEAARGRWQSVCIHGFTNKGNGGYQPVQFDGWVKGVEYAKTKNIWIATMVDVAAYIIGGKAVSSASPTAEGGGQKWTWTLQNNFPPGHYVRVTVDGGTLSQDGKPLPWNEHGFYEVALDVGELTLAP